MQQILPQLVISLAVKPRGLALSGTAAQGKAAIRIFTQYIAHCHGVLELLILVCCVLPLASTLTQQQENDFPIVNRAFNAIRKVGLHWNKEQRITVSVSRQDIAV